MAGLFSIKRFSDLDLKDPFFDSLKKDYQGNQCSKGFTEWYSEKAKEGAKAIVYTDDEGIGAFIALKKEEETIELRDLTLPKKKRLKIRTFNIAPRYRKQRIGEGAIGLVLWWWQKSDTEEIYFTAYDKQETLISQFKKYGFSKIGTNSNGELVLAKNRNRIKYSDPYESFPFIHSGFEYAGYILIDDVYHDTVFPYSELAGVQQLGTLSGSMRNGVSKIYVGQDWKRKYYIGEPVLVYRKYTKGNGKRYRSCVTSYCVVNDIIQAKVNGSYLITFDELKTKIKNKSVFDEAELLRQYNNNKNVMVIELVYYGFFGSGNNINLDWLDNNGLWIDEEPYPTDIRLTEEQFKTILTEGNVDVSNVIIH